MSCDDISCLELIINDQFDTNSLTHNYVVELIRIAVMSSITPDVDGRTLLHFAIRLPARNWAVELLRRPELSLCLHRG